MKVLAIGAHPDDIELGCGGALLEHRDAGHDLTLLVMTEGNRGPQGMITRVDEQVEVARLLGARLLWGGFEDGAVPSGHAAVAVIEAAMGDGVDVVYTHTPDDTHQDHRATAEATFAASRRTPRVLCFETPSSVGFTPTLFVDIDGRVEGKLDLLRIHLSQVLAGGPVDLEAVEAQARFRGAQARARNAEAFSVHRLLWEPVTIAAHPRREATVAVEEVPTPGPAAGTADDASPPGGNRGSR